MKFYKWLTGLVAAIFFTLIIAWATSFLFKIDVNWYNSLNKPYFMPSKSIYQVCVTMTYFFTTIILAHLIVKRNFGARIIILMVTGVLSVLFVFVFFDLKLIYLSTVIVAFIWALTLAFTVMSLPNDLFSAISCLPLLLWRSYLFVCAFTLALHN